MSKLASAIFAHDLDLASEIIDVPEWGVKLKVLEPTADRRADLAQTFIASDGDDSARMKRLYPALLIACVVDPEDDTAVFSPEDAYRLMQKEGRLVEKLAQASMKVCGFTSEADGDPKGDSSVTSSDDPSTTSPSD